MTTNAQLAMHYRQLGDEYRRLADALVPQPSSTPATPAPHQLPAAVDARQRTVLALFDPLDPTAKVVLPWDGSGSVVETALSVGYTVKSVYSLLRSLLAWDDEAERSVTITDKGRARFREIVARGLVV